MPATNTEASWTNVLGTLGGQESIKVEHFVIFDNATILKTSVSIFIVFLLLRLFRSKKSA